MRWRKDGIMAGNFSDVHCTKCGAPTRYDILKRQYRCGYCGSEVEVKEAQAQKQGFRSIQQEKIKSSARNYQLMTANCSGCGATIVFEKGEAMSDCAFCGRALVRKEYLKAKELPELILPFRITEEEARACLENWCEKNRGKREAKHLKPITDKLKGFYLPYELVRGPVSCKVSRMDGGRTYGCSGNVEDIFINCSHQLDNLLLDGMEPYELDELEPFDFAYAAGQRVKVGDISAKELKGRIGGEVTDNYAPVVRKTLETKAISVQVDAENVLRMPVLLPVYFICSGETMAAVNGQTGKVSVRAEKVSHHYFLPWWFKAILATALIIGLTFAALYLFGWSVQESAYFSGLLGMVIMIVTLTVYSDTVRNRFRVEAERKIFTSSGGPLRRIDGKLVQAQEELKREVTPPAFFERLDGTMQHVQLVFNSPLRALKTILIAVVALFLPVMIALFLNGFDFARLELGGSAVWFCIMVPVVPIYILKFARIELYERPWIYVISEDGKKTRYRKKTEVKVSKDVVTTILRGLFIPPVSLAVWFAILSFCVMCYLTAFGF
jgi:ribosomal protein S27E